MLDRRLLLVTGKGGTGRSALTASLAIAASRRGGRVLALALDGGAGLARHLGLAHLGAVPEHSGGLWAARVEPAAALDEYLRLRLRVPRLAAAGRVFAAVADTVPGVRDTVMIGKAIHESTAGRWDLVVVDGPPAGQVASFLAAPATVAELVPGGAVRQQSAALQDRLADPGHTRLVVVATPEELAVAEADECRHELATLVGAITVVANRVLAPAAADTDPSAVGAWHRALVAAQAGPLARLEADYAVPWFFGIHAAEETAARMADRWSAS